MTVDGDGGHPHGHGEHHAHHPETHGGQHAGHGAHDKHAGHSPEMFRDKFWLSLLLTLPVVFWSDHVQMLLGYRAPAFGDVEFGHHLHA